MSEIATRPKNHKFRVYGQSCAMALEINKDNNSPKASSEYVAQSDLYYLTLQIAPSNGKREYDWNTETCILLKLSQNEVLELASVFLRIKNNLKIDKRKTTHRTHAAYKNVNITVNQGGGLLIQAGLIPVEKQSFQRLLHTLPVSQMDCVGVGLFLLGYLTLKMPWVSSESIITALRLSESKNPS